MAGRCTRRTATVVRSAIGPGVTKLAAGVVTMAFDPGTGEILQAATNFFASAMPIARIVIGIMIGGYVVATLVNVIRGRQSS